MKLNVWHWSLNVKRKMALKDNTPITGWEKWINRIVTAALAAWQAIQYLIAHWSVNPPIQ